VAPTVAAETEIAAMKSTSGKGKPGKSAPRTALPGVQAGASAVGSAILLVIAAYGVFVGIQYVPQLIESSSVGSILNSIEHEHRAEPIGSAHALRGKIDDHLSINQLNHLRDSFTVREFGNDYIVEVSYERELNLLYETKTIKYANSLTLH
jgi:hypothetical protein